MFSSKCETFAVQVAYAWVPEVFSKWGGTSARQKTRKSCDLNWQLLHHKHWNMTSLTFVSMF